MSNLSADDYDNLVRDAMKWRKRQMDNDELVLALRAAVEVIKGWHNTPSGAISVWDIYYENAPEMKQIREVLAKVTARTPAATA